MATSPPISRAVAIYAVQALDQAVGDLTAPAGTAASLDAAVDLVASVRRKLATELWGDSNGGCRYCGDPDAVPVPDPCKQPGDPTREEVRTCDVHFPAELLGAGQ